MRDSQVPPVAPTVPPEGFEGKSSRHLKAGGGHSPNSLFCPTQLLLYLSAPQCDVALTCKPGCLGCVALKFNETKQLMSCVYDKKDVTIAHYWYAWTETGIIMNASR